MKFYSPLRYPGGKSKLAPLINLLISNADIQNCTYIEPFAGGGGVALTLLLENKVDRIIINDYDCAVYAFWRAIKTDAKELCRLVTTTPITIDEWHKQRHIYNISHKYSVELAFATLFLNRTNRSGILTGGPIGGYEQAGEWKLDVRFDREAIAERILAIASRKDSIVVYNKDIISLVDKYIPRYSENAFIYFDPPYYNKGQKLYKNFFSPDDHRRIAERINNHISCPWVITYDNVPEIRMLYHGYEIRQFDLTYSAANKGTASEIIICSKPEMYPSAQEMIKNGIQLNIRPQGEEKDN